MKKPVVLIFLLLLSLPATAADWIRVRPLAEGDQYFYDRSKLYINGDEITYWKKVAFRKPATVKGQAAVSGLYRERIHCAEHTLKLISYLLYAGDGNTIEYIASHEGESAPIIPDTVGDVFEKTVCELVRQKQEATRRKAAEEAGEAESGKVKPVPPAGKSGEDSRPPAENAALPDQAEKAAIPAASPPAVVN